MFRHPSDHQYIRKIKLRINSKKKCTNNKIVGMPKIVLPFDRKVTYFSNFINNINTINKMLVKKEACIIYDDCIIEIIVFIELFQFNKKRQHA